MVRIWELPAHSGRPGGLENGAHLRTMCFIDEGRRFFVAGDAGVLRVWDARTGEPQAAPMTHAVHVRGSAIAPDGRVVAIVAQTRDSAGARATTVTLRNLANWTVVGPSITGPGDPLAVAFSADGAEIITLATGKNFSQERDQRFHIERGPVTFTRWNATTGAVLGRTADSAEGAWFAALSPDGSRAAVADNLPAPGFRISDTTTGQPVAERVALDAHAWHLEFSPDGKRLAVATAVTPGRGSSGIARVYDTLTAAPLTAAMSHDAEVVFAGFSADGTRLVTTSYDATARVWDAATGAPLTGPLRHQWKVVHATFSADGRRLATASGDGTARMWDVDTGELLAPPFNDFGRVFFAWCHPDGSSVVSAGEDGICRIWKLTTTAEPVATLRKRAALHAAEQFHPRFGAVPATPAELRTLWTDLR